MRIYFVGMPVMMLYNFGSAILRAVGDTQRPLYFLFIAGVVNVILNLIFVIVFHMGVEGVAIPTVISQCVSAALVLFCLVKSDTVYRVDLKKLRITKHKLWQMVKIGVPAGIQSATFSISNVLIQSSVNSFGSIAMAGSTAGSNIDGFVWTAMDAFTQSTLSFTSQNFGAKKFHRITKVIWYNLLLVTGGGAGAGHRGLSGRAGAAADLLHRPGGHPLRGGAYAAGVRPLRHLRHYERDGGAPCGASAPR